MFKTLFLSLVLVIAQAGPAVFLTVSRPLRLMRPYPAILAALGVAPVPTDFTPSDSSAFATGYNQLRRR